MATVIGHLLDAQIETMKHSARRWADRKDVREAGLKELERKGLGAADTLKQQLQFAQRTQRAVTRSLGGLNFNEAIIGPNDLVAFAPSEVSKKAARPVARIVTLPGKGYQPQGIASGFLVSDAGLLLTNHHVFSNKGDVSGYGVNFEHLEDENGVSDGQYFELDPDRFFVSNKALDFTLVAIKPKGLSGESLSALGFSRLIEATGKVATGEHVNIIQHPGGGPRRFAIRDNQLVDILPEGFLHYEADTERGSSGSPVFSPRWELIALHHSGVPRVENGVILTTKKLPFNPYKDKLTDVDWVANEGTRVSFIVEGLRKLSFESSPQKLILDRLLDSTIDPLAMESASDRPTTANMKTTGSHDMGNIFNISGQITINVYPDFARTSSSADQKPDNTRSDTGGVNRGLSAEKTLVFDPAYTEREGYDPKFLGTEIPLPGIIASREAELYTVGDYQEFSKSSRAIPEIDTSGLNATAPFVLDYHHYSLAFNKKYFMCAWAASNCDYRDEMRQDSRSREELGGENWRADPRIPAELQLLDRDVYKPARRVDRGHIVRREDSCWGPAGIETDYANSDTYHYTNCTPQHEAFNQENPSDRTNPKVLDYAKLGVNGVWGAFEAAVQKQLKDGGGQATIFSGPVLKDFLDVRDWATGKVSTPKRFWKIVIVPEGKGRRPKLLSYGYVFDQTDVVKRFGLTVEEALVLPKFEDFRCSIEKISQMVGVTFDDVVLQAEQPIP